MRAKRRFLLLRGPLRESRGDRVHSNEKRDPLYYAVDPDANAFQYSLPAFELFVTSYEALTKPRPPSRRIGKSKSGQSGGKVSVLSDTVSPGSLIRYPDYAHPRRQI